MCKDDSHELAEQKQQKSKRLILLRSTLTLGGGSRRNIAMPFGAGKLEWLGYSMVKKFKDILIRFERM